MVMLVRLLSAVELYWSGEASPGRAAELAGVSLSDDDGLIGR